MASSRWTPPLPFAPNARPGGTEESETVLDLPNVGRRSIPAHRRIAHTGEAGALTLLDIRFVEEPAEERMVRQPPSVYVPPMADSREGGLSSVDLPAETEEAPLELAWARDQEPKLRRETRTDARIYRPARGGTSTDAALRTARWAVLLVLVAIIGGLVLSRSSSSAPTSAPITTPAAHE